MIRYGLDFGTTNSSIGLAGQAGLDLLQIDSQATDPQVIRSLLYFFHRDLEIKEDRRGITHFNYSGEFLHTIGQNAVDNFLKDNKNRTPGIKIEVYTGRFLHQSFSPDAGPANLVAEYYEDVDYGTGRLLQALKSALKHPLYKGTNIFGKFFTLEELMGFFISQIRKNANEIVGQEIDNVKVGRPVVFSPDKKVDAQAEDRLREGLKMAGFKRIEFEYEPVAAARYFLKTHNLPRQKVLVFDFGGGTLDTAIVEWDGQFKVLATDGVYIGGNLLNSDMMENKLLKYFGSDLSWGDSQVPLPRHITESLKSWFAIPNLNNPDDMRFLQGQAKYRCSDLPSLERLIYLIKMNLGFELYETIENAKKELSFKAESVIKFIDGPIQIEEPITKQEFETIIHPRIAQVKETVLRTLTKAKLAPEEIGIVVRTGGSSLIPVVENMLADIFGGEKVQLFDTFTSIAAGLALE